MLPTSGGAIARILIVLGIFILLSYIALGCLARIVQADEGTVPLPNEVVVRFESCKAVPGIPQPLFAGWSRVQADAPGAVSSCSEVYPIYPVTIFDTDTTLPNDPNISLQYSLPKMSVPTAWDTARGDGVVIAILDTGADFTHPDLASKFVSRGRDFVNNDNDASDDHGHGTHVSGIAAAATNNGVGIAGVGFNARLLPVKVLASNGGGDTAEIAQAIDWASQQSGVKVINLSLGCQCPSPAYLTDAVSRARSRGVVVIAAAGNSASSFPASPASAPGVIGVGATDQYDQRASYSNFGVNARLAAPGSNIYSTLRGGGYGNMSGTSMASPNAAGVAALVWSACPACSVGDVEARLLNGDDIGGQQIGKRLNAARAVSASGPLPTLTPGPTPRYPTATPPVSGNKDTAIVDAINAQRKNYGLAPLLIDPALTSIARAHNAYMDEHNCFDHQCPGEETVWQRLARAGYSNYAGSEVIARGYDTVDNLVRNGWMMSDGHRAILLGNYNMVGCAWDEFDAGYMGRWMTCDFGKRTGVPPTATPVPPPPNGLPGGWLMLVYLPRSSSAVVYDYDDRAVTKPLADAVYRHVCQDLAPQGARCEWRRK